MAVPCRFCGTDTVNGTDSPTFIVTDDGDKIMLADEEFCALPKGTDPKTTDPLNRTIINTTNSALILQPTIHPFVHSP